MKTSERRFRSVGGTERSVLVLLTGVCTESSCSSRWQLWAKITSVRIAQPTRGEFTSGSADRRRSHEQNVFRRSNLRNEEIKHLSYLKCGFRFNPLI